MKINLLLGDCVARMAEMPDGSVGSIVSDPPYGLRFMNKEFDDLGDGAAQREWHRPWLAEAYRVLRPGGVIKAFGGTRTFHHLAATMRTVGFTGVGLEAWSYGSGFPKSLNISKATDKATDKAGASGEEEKFCAWLRGACAEDTVRRTLGARFWECRVEVVNTATADAPRYARRALVPTHAAWVNFLKEWGGTPPDEVASYVKNPPQTPITHPSEWKSGKGEGTFGTNIWQGWGTALKPSWEPVVVGRKPE